jgi:hypothetical protein
MEGVQHLPAHQQQAFMKEMEHMQLKDSLTYVPRAPLVPADEVPN